MNIETETTDQLRGMRLEEVQRRASETWKNLQNAIPVGEREALAPFIEILTDRDYVREQQAQAQHV